MIECRMEWKRRPTDGNGKGNGEQRTATSNKTLFVSFHYFPHLSVFIPLLIEFIKCKHANIYKRLPLYNNNPPIPTLTHTHTQPHTRRVWPTRTLTLTWNWARFVWLEKCSSHDYCWLLILCFTLCPLNVSIPPLTISLPLSISLILCFSTVQLFIANIYKYHSKLQFLLEM